MTSNVTSSALIRALAVALVAIAAAGCADRTREPRSGTPTTDGGTSGRDATAPAPGCFDVSGAYELGGMNPAGCPPTLSCTVSQTGCTIDVSCAGLSFSEEIRCSVGGACSLTGTASIGGVAISVTGTFEVPVSGGAQTGAPTRASFESASPDGLVCRYETGTSGGGGCDCDTTSGCEMGCMCDDDCGGGGGGDMCTDTCPTAHDGECDDGGPGSLYDVCALGTDCADCGPRDGSSCSCAGRECGGDGCGGSCGSCRAGEECNASGQCVDDTVPSCSCDGGRTTCDIGCDCDPDCDGNASCRVRLGSTCSPGSSSPSDCCAPGMTCTCPRGSGSSCAFAVCMASLNSSCSSDIDCRDGASCTSGYCR